MARNPHPQFFMVKGTRFSEIDPGKKYDLPFDGKPKKENWKGIVGFKGGVIGFFWSSSEEKKYRSKKGWHFICVPLTRENIFPKQVQLPDYCRRTNGNHYGKIKFIYLEGAIKEIVKEV